MSRYAGGGNPHDPALSRVPVDAEGLAGLVRTRYTGDHGLRRIRDLAALLAEKRPVHRLLPLLERLPAEPGGWAELVACLTQELVVRRVDLTRVPSAVRCAATLRELRHPLAELPLKRSRGERRVGPCDFPWRVQSGFHVPEPPPIALREGEGGGRECASSWDARQARTPVCAPRVVSTGRDERLITSAVRHWSSASLAVIVEPPRRFDPREVASSRVNAFLPESLGAGGVLNGRLESLDTVVGELFTAAYCDSLFSTGSRGGYGRVRAWRSIAGLVRAPAGASVHRVNELAARWTWMAFRLTRREPYWVDQEIAIGALSPRGNALGLLISHDTD
ncbi:DUF6183 family protein [Streptosporangium sp. V21-05]|uniref:DUF6183 family protein n=1 Tax=Streptosporangium sp. V21-05 TaxID=3446115 RepID=UPI003F53237A